MDIAEEDHGTLMTLGHTYKRILQKNGENQEAEYFVLQKDEQQQPPGKKS